MRVDLHIHTRPRSSCSGIDPAKLGDAARKAGLDAICLTEHQNPWEQADMEELSRGGGIRVFQGNEVTTKDGDVLVFGCDVNVSGVVPVQELRKEVKRAGGIMIAAHPFRGFLLFGISQLQLDLDQASRRKIFQYVDGLEILNCKVTQPENDLARRVAERLGLPGVAGSDAHRLEEVGKCVTVFQREIQNDRELAEELRAGRFTVEQVKG